MDECVKTKYDTYIEFKFFEKLDTCIKNAKSRERIRTAWLTDKALYTDFTKTIEFEFMNYSLHDASHSISILQCIYMLLGKNKIDRLSVGDLWLLLECAYSHDIGMATCYDELKEFWKNDNEIEKQVRKISVSADRDIISMYKKVRDWINSNGIEPDIINIFKEHYEWPLEIRKAVTYINSEYIRQFHAKRSNDKILEILEEQSRLRIEDRLYKAVGNINYLHGTDFKEIFTLLESQAIGFETDKIHPRLIAQLLRVGDSLDIRNNRFDYSNIKYQGGLSGISNLHYEKHKNVTHFLVDDTKVQIYIESNDIDVCRNARDWFDIIENQLALLMKYWNAFAPRCLGGLKLTDIDLQVKFDGNIFEFENFDKVLKADPKKVLDILIGSNVYSTNLVCFREYLQNALDATKMRIADELSEDEEYLKLLPYDKITDITPEDIDKKYFEQYEIQIIIDFEDRDKNLIKFKIIDQGIGMDKEGIQALCNIGTGWNGRSNTKKLLIEMPEWLKPTGGFGIGLLSGFLLTDKISIKTKSKKGERYCIDVYTPSTGLQIEQIVDSDYYGPLGTEISFVVPFEKYYKEIFTYLNRLKDYSIEQHNNDEEIEQNTTHDKSNIENFIEELYSLRVTDQQMLFIEKTLKKIIDDYILDTVIPVKIINQFNRNETKINKNKIYLLSDGRLLDDKMLWFSNYNTAVSIKVDHSQNNVSTIGYRGIRTAIIENTGSNNILNDKMNILCNTCFDSIDIFDDKVSNMLMLSREEIKDNRRLMILIEGILREYLNFLIESEFYSTYSSHFEKILLYFSSFSNDYYELLSLLPKNYYKIYSKEFIPKEIIGIINEFAKKADDLNSWAIASLNHEPKDNEYINKLNKELHELFSEYNDVYRNNKTIIENYKYDGNNDKYSNNIILIKEVYKITSKERKNVNYNEVQLSAILNNLCNIKQEACIVEIDNNKASLIEEIIKNKSLHLIINGNISTPETLKKENCENEEILYAYKNHDEIKNYLNQIKILFDVKIDYHPLGDNGFLVHIYRIEDEYVKKDFDMCNAVVNAESEPKEFIEISNDTVPQLEKEYGTIMTDIITNKNNDKKIIHPFGLDKKSNEDIKTIIKVLREKEINGKPLYDTKIRRTLSNIFDNSDRFKNIINLVYELQDRKYTKEEIKVQYMNLIYVVITRIYNGEFQEYVEE